ncbi:hypothetical protein EIN_018660 [Entamoeba invadens IP1]|uniref:hypothetical protein n=1 Tax=Entamoeba invadens IP1 TaxID=370355 RepID=UPI0002C3F597|nr:hypothetical protein EIN_018660 [Entamoeba invadens IP1]ELP90507.1 hypothetical protein EIN_018660 [Entamoeba invadens IP1]|eukprot:XP_004257278.1 hypothetical protein EIN_018660 [Entamoeba invadens IP1]
MSNTATQVLNTFAYSAQVTSVVLLTSFIRTMTQESYSISLLILISEATKFVLSGLFLLFVKHKDGLFKYYVELYKNVPKCLFDGLFLFFELFLTQFALTTIHPLLFVALTNCSYVFLALSSIRIRNRITLTQWRAVGGIVVSVVAVVNGAFNFLPSIGKYEKIVGVISALLVAVIRTLKDVAAKNSEVKDNEVLENNFLTPMITVPCSLIALVTLDLGTLKTNDVVFGYTLGTLALSLTLSTFITSFLVVIPSESTKLFDVFAMLSVLGCQFFVVKYEFSIELTLGVFALCISLLNYNDTKASSNYQNEILTLPECAPAERNEREINVETVETEVVTLDDLASPVLNKLANLKELEE